MKKAFLALMLLLVTTQSAYGGWWGGGKSDEAKDDTVRESPSTPFDPPYLEPFVESECLQDSPTEIKKVSYHMDMKSTLGHWGSALKCKDSHLNLKIKISFMGDDYSRPVECVVTTNDDISYISQDIWICEVSEYKFTYVVDFPATKTKLVVYKPKKSTPRAFWIVLN